MQTTRLCDRRRVLHRDHVLALRAAVAELGDGGGGVGQQPCRGRPDRSTPWPRRERRCGARPCLEMVDDGVERRRIDQPLLDQQQLQRLHPQRDVGWRLLAMFVIVRHAGNLAEGAWEWKMARFEQRGPR